LKSPLKKETLQQKMERRNKMYPLSINKTKKIILVLIIIRVCV